MRAFKGMLGVVCAGALLVGVARPADAAAPRFKIVVIGENDIHGPFVAAAKVWLDKLAADSNLAVTYLENPNSLTDALLAGTDVVWQANYTPYRWPAAAKTSFEKYMNAGKGGWVGNHHASLYGTVVTQEMWPFFAKLIGEISYKNYVSKFASGDVRSEDSIHPVMKGVPAKFTVTTEEWYTWDKNPRPKVKVLANLDEASMKFTDQGESGIKMGDHPVVWSYEGYTARNVYIFMGHHPNLFQNAAYVTLLRNALFWASNKTVPTELRPAAHGRGIKAARTGKARDLAGRRIPKAGAAAWRRAE